MRPCFLLVLLALVLAPPVLPGAPVFSEIMFHPPPKPSPVGEDSGEEWVELFNDGTTALDLSGWKLTKGVSFTFPNGTTLAAAAHLVVAADTTKFQGAHPTFAGQVVGGWIGRLSNSGEEIQLDDAAGQKAADVTYADEGDWALRARGPLSFSRRGWVWESGADGSGRSLELRNATLGAGSGQNWGVSLAAGGTPGATNSIASADVAPLIKDAKHRPRIPRSGEPIVVSCTLEDEGPGATATLHWRLDAGAWQQSSMSDADGDGDVEATIPAQANLTVIEWYVAATDGAQTRTWPAAARVSDPGASPESFAQGANALIQVDNAFDPAANFATPGSEPLYRFVMTNAERAELALIGSNYAGKPADEEQSVATMNGTFLSHDGTGVKVVYNAGIRNRGFGSALGPPNNFHVSFRSDDRWNGRSAMQLNCQYPHSQALGNALFALAGVAAHDPAIVRVRVNGADLAQSGASMYGRYVRLEGRGGEWAERHFPNDPDGNFYRLDDHAYSQGDARSGEFRWEGSDPTAYGDTFFKETNKEADDFTDLIEFARVVSAPATGGTAQQPAIPDAAYPAAVAAKLDLDQFYRYFAADALMGNQEGGLQSGRADDVSIYRGVVDPRFRFIPHDLDDVFNIGVGAGDPITRSLFSYDTLSGGVVGLTRLFNHPRLVPRYYAAVLDALGSWFTSAKIDPLIEQIMAGSVPAEDGGSTPPNTSIAEIKAFVAQRRANVLSQIQQVYSLNVTTSATSSDGYKQTNDGSAIFAGTFNVARTYSVTVNGQLAQSFYRTAGTDAAGSWKLIVPAGGGAVLRPGLNRAVVNFWDGINGTGSVLQSLTADVFYNTGVGTVVSGTLSAGSLRVTAPSSYLPGKPFLVRVDLLDTRGALDRTAWDATAALTSNVPGITLPAVQLFNGTGSALVTAGGGGSQPAQVFFSYGTGGTGPATVNGTPGSAWKAKTDLTSATIGSIPATWKDEGFDDASWPTLRTQTGYGDLDENQSFIKVDYNGATSGTPTAPSYLFRSSFTTTTAELAQFASISGEVKYDDAAAVFVNGTQVFRSANLPAGALLTNYSGAGATDNTTAAFTVPLALLHDGVNTIAVEVHQDSSTSSDVTFDLKMQANFPASDPGNFTLTASAAGFTAQKSLTSLGSTPAMTIATGPLAAGTTTWSGVVRVTGDVTVPAGATLAIEPGTHVLVDGDANAGSTAGKRIIVNGALNSQGTEANPVSITAFNAGDRWGQISFSNAQPSTLSFTLLSHAGHATGVGHTGRGPMLRMAGSTVTLLDTVLADGPAKAIYSSGTCDLTIQRSIIERMITGPELGDGIALLIEDSNIQRILPDYRESNAAAPDDEDCLYVHNAPQRSVVIRRSVFARCGDDLFDCLGGPITVEDSILREAWDKGMSLLNNDLTITRTQIIDCDKAIVPKSSVAARRTIDVSQCTIRSENHDTSQSPWGYPVAPSDADPDTPSTGFYTQNKSGQSDPGATLVITAVNCIVQAEAPVLVDSLYDPANTVVTYSDLLLETGAAFAWPGAGNLGADPLFANLQANDYRLTSLSPARDAGDPASPLDPDGSRADMGARPYRTVVAGGTLTWSASGGPYRVTDHLTIPVGTTLAIQPGTSIFVAQGKRITVQGRLLAQGSPGSRIVFSHIPGTVAPGDCDLIKLGTQTGPPKWGGVRVIDSMAQENIVSYCDFINAQGTDPETSENWGSIGFIRSWGLAEHLTFAGTHLRMLYGRNPKLTVRHCLFPDMFLFDPVLGRIEEPTTDFVATADNRQEPLKVEYPVTDIEVTGSGNFSANGFPLGGWWRVYFNDFHGNRGHNDVLDADSGRWGAPGDFLLDCRYNYFHGLTGDEHIDLGGDAYIASNIFERSTKDAWTSDTGYSNAISSGDKGTGTTIVVARNLFFDLDHAINLKANTGTIFEHNTVANFHADFTYNGGASGTFTQDVKCAAINVFIPEDGANPTRGDGGYLGFNVLSNIPRLISGADTRKSDGMLVNDVTTKVEFAHNLVDAISDLAIGANHPGGIFDPAYGVNTTGAPGFVDAAAKDFRLAPGSDARGTAPGGIDYGWSVPEWAYLLGGPGLQTSMTSATFTVGGPGIVAYKWRLDGGAWSAPAQIGDGGVFPRNAPTTRQATLTLTGLAQGTHTLEVLGQDMAGNWQDADPARDGEGLPQATPTTRTWTVDASLSPIRLSEVLAHSATQVDRVELRNVGASDVSLAGWTLTDDPAIPHKFALAPFGALPAGGYVAASYSNPTLGLDRDGDAVYLFQNGVLRDSVTFGPQITDLTIGRVGVSDTWVLCQPTLGAENVAQRLGDANVVRINEWFASGGVLYQDDWIELVNPGALPVSITGLRLTENAVGNPGQHVFAPLSFIGANGFLKLLADGDTSAGPSHLDFSLDAEQEQLSLFSSEGALLDQVFFFPQTTDLSMGRNDSGSYSFYELPTGGLANGTANPGFANALAVLRGLRITEIMFNPAGGNDYEFVELRNVGATSLQLAGVKFVSGIDFTFGALSLQPGENVLVVSHLGRFRDRYGLAPRLAGQYAGKLDNSGETLALQLPPPFDANVLTFAFADSWHPITDGLGKSLIVFNPLVHASAWSDKDAWTYSPAPYGDPDGRTIADPDHLAAWLSFHGSIGAMSDDDYDGSVALLEYALATNPNSGVGDDGPAAQPVASIAADGALDLRFEAPENPGSAQGHGPADLTYIVEATADLVDWTVIATKSPGTLWSGTATVTVGPPNGGLVPITIRDPGAADGHRLLRLRAIWTQ